MKFFPPFSVWALAVACLFMFGLGFYLTLNSKAKTRFFAMPYILQKAYVAAFMAPIVAIPLVQQPRYEWAHLASTLAGTLLLTSALGIWISALRAMKGIPSMRQANGLVSQGVYGIVRHPLYTANSLLLPGLGLLTQSLAALCFSPVVLALFLLQSKLEERDLLAAYGNAYATYTSRVRHRLIPFLL